MLEIIKVITVLVMAIPFVYMIVNVAYELVRMTGDLFSKKLKPVRIHSRRHHHK